MKTAAVSDRIDCLRHLWRYGHGNKQRGSSIFLDWQIVMRCVSSLNCGRAIVNVHAMIGATIAE